MRRGIQLSSCFSLQRKQEKEENKHRRKEAQKERYREKFEATYEEEGSKKERCCGDEINEREKIKVLPTIAAAAAAAAKTECTPLSLSTIPSLFC